MVKASWVVYGTSSQELRRSSVIDVAVVSASAGSLGGAKASASRPPPNLCGDFFDPVSEFGSEAYFLTRSFGGPCVREWVGSSVLLTVDEHLREQRPQFP